jgi:hypothetical protein
MKGASTIEELRRAVVTLQRRDRDTRAQLRTLTERCDRKEWLNPIAEREAYERACSIAFGTDCPNRQHCRHSSGADGFSGAREFPLAVFTVVQSVVPINLCHRWRDGAPRLLQKG